MNKTYFDLSFVVFFALEAHTAHIHSSVFYILILLIIKLIIDIYQTEKEEQHRFDDTDLKNMTRHLIITFVSKYLLITLFLIGILKFNHLNNFIRQVQSQIKSELITFSDIFCYIIGIIWLSLAAYYVYSTYKRRNL